MEYFSDDTDEQQTECGVQRLNNTGGVLGMKSYNKSRQNTSPQATPSALAAHDPEPRREETDPSVDFDVQLKQSLV